MEGFIHGGACFSLEFYGNHTNSHRGGQSQNDNEKRLKLSHSSYSCIS